MTNKVKINRSDSKVVVIIPAAGRGSRMKSIRPKSLHTVNGKPLLEYARRHARSISNTKPVVVLGHKAKEVENKFGNVFTYVTQPLPLGNADAVKRALTKVPSQTAHVVILHVDSIVVLPPMIIQRALEQHRNSHSSLTVPVSGIKEFSGTGGVAQVAGIYQAIESLPRPKGASKIQYINRGIFISQFHWLKQNLRTITRNRRSKEFQLSDLISIAAKQNKLTLFNIDSRKYPHVNINTKKELKQAEQIIRSRKHNPL